jgi:hypothetical protein
VDGRSGKPVANPGREVGSHLLFFWLVKRFVVEALVELECFVRCGGLLEEHPASGRRHEPIGGAVEKKERHLEGLHLCPNFSTSSEHFSAGPSGYAAVIIERIVLGGANDFRVARNDPLRGAGRGKFGGDATEHLGETAEEWSQGWIHFNGGGAQDDPLHGRRSLKDVFESHKPPHAVPEKEERQIWGLRPDEGEHLTEVVEVVFEAFDVGTASPGSAVASLVVGVNGELFLGKCVSDPAISPTMFGVSVDQYDSGPEGDIRDEELRMQFDSIVRNERPTVSRRKRQHVECRCG